MWNFLREGLQIQVSDNMRMQLFKLAVRYKADAERS